VSDLTGAFAHMMEMEGATHEFDVERTPETILRDGIDTSFSAVAMTALVEAMGTWVGTRILRVHDARGIMPQRVKVTVTVETDLSE
jgi:hypothetical protein